MLSTQLPKETDQTPAEKNIKRSIIKQKTLKRNNKTPLKRLKTRKFQKRMKQDMDSKEIGIFNIDEECKNDSISENANKYYMFNSPTPDASGSKLDIGFDDSDVKSHIEKKSMINIDLKQHPRNLKLNLVSNINNSQISNEEDRRLPIGKTQHASTSPTIPLEKKQLKYFKEIGIGTKEPDETQTEQFELKKSKLYKLFIENFDNYTALSEYVSLVLNQKYRCIAVTQSIIFSAPKTLSQP